MSDRSDLRIIFMGTPDFASVCMDSLVKGGYNVVLAVCQPDKPVGRKHILTPPPVKVLATELGIECYQPSTLKTEEAYDTLKAVGADLIVTAAYGKILPQNVLDIPKYGCLNCHGSLLPARRGAAPVQRAILEGDKVTGVTIMKMDAGMDTGDILKTVEVPIDPDIHTDELMMELAHKGADLLISMIDDFVDGNITPVPQDGSKATMCPPIAPEEGHFEWTDKAEDIHNRVRALSSWPGASTVCGGKKLKIYDSRVMPDRGYVDGPAGTVVAAHKSDLIVRCGEGCLKINSLQSEGGKRLNAADCAHNYKVGQPI